MKYAGIKEVVCVGYDSNAVIRKRIKKKGSRLLSLVMFQVGMVLLFFACLLLVNFLGVDSEVFDAVKSGFGLF